MKLAERQREFLARLYGEAQPRGAVAVYRRNVLANLGASLAATYPVVRRLVGDAFFDEAGERFAHAQPSRSGDLHRFGEGFADFLAGYAPARDLEYLPDVARLEWLCAESFHAPDGSAFDFAALAAIPAAERTELRLRLHPAVRRLRSDHAIAAIWEANQPSRDGTPARRQGSDHVVVHREGYEVRVVAADSVSWRFLDAVARGMTLAAIADDDALAPRLAEELARWTRCGVVDGFER